MIAVVDEFRAAAQAEGCVAAAFSSSAPETIPVAAANTLQALIAVSNALARVRRVAKRAMQKKKPATVLAPLLATQVALEQTQLALAQAVSAILDNAPSTLAV